MHMMPWTTWWRDKNVSANIDLSSLAILYIWFYYTYNWYWYYILILRITFVTYIQTQLSISCALQRGFVLEFTFRKKIEEVIFLTIASIEADIDRYAWYIIIGYWSISLSNQALKTRAKNVMVTITRDCIHTPVISGNIL